MKISYLVTIGLGVSILLLIASIVRQSFAMVEAHKRLTNARTSVVSLLKTQHQLQYQAAQRDNPDYIEQQIRNKFHMVKPGESMIILPPQLQNKQASDSFYIPQETTIQPVLAKPIWQLWRELIF